ncbi:MAG: L-2-amino-thiazoline-4-carboxylic acid hydrolase, partial [Acholeplasmatales bacterium]|nr:L-2-amino-thiazoline-4-carboxylic acid hydrolase [Acholeplasmatales bacterium]
RKYKGKYMIEKSRHINYFNILDPDLQNDIKHRIDQIVKEEEKYCDKKNYEHLCNMFSLIAIYEVLQMRGVSEEDAFNKVRDEMFKFIEPYSQKFQKMSKKGWFWPLIKKIVPMGFNKKSGYGWRYTWHNDTPKNEFRFETNECIYQKILKERNLTKLGPLFCQCDVINYGKLHGIDFRRSKTLCYGDDECNFIFIKHDDEEEFERFNAK